MTASANNDPADLASLGQQLEQVLKLRVPPIGMRLFESNDVLTAIPKLRRPQAVHTTDQIVAQACRLGWTVGITADDLVGAQCKAVIGLGRSLGMLDLVATADEDRLVGHLGPDILTRAWQLVRPRRLVRRRARHRRAAPSRRRNRTG